MLVIHCEHAHDVVFVGQQEREVVLVGQVPEVARLLLHLFEGGRASDAELLLDNLLGSLLALVQLHDVGRVHLDLDAVDVRSDLGVLILLLTDVAIGLLDHTDLLLDEVPHVLLDLLLPDSIYNVLGLWHVIFLFIIQ